MTKKYPLLSAQKRVCYSQLMLPTSPMHNLGGVVLFDGQVDFDRLSQCITQLLNLNPILRMQYRCINGEHTQVLCDAERTEFPVQYFDEQDAQTVILNWASVQMSIAMQFENAPLFEFVLLKGHDNTQGFFIKLHHFIADGWTFAQISRQLSKAYSQCTEADSVDATDTDFEFLFQQEEKYRHANRYEKDAQYWQQKFATLPDLSMFPVGNDAQAERFKLTLSDEQTAMFAQLCEQYHCTENTLLVATAVLQMYLRTRVLDLTVGLPVFNRTCAKSKHQLGMLTSTVCARFSVNTQATLAQFVEQVNATLRQDYRHQKYPYEELVSALSLAQSGQRRLYHMSVNYYKGQNVECYGAVPASNFEVFSGAQDHDLQWVLTPKTDAASSNLYIDYKSSCYQAGDIAQMASQLFFIMQQFLCDSTLCVAQLRSMDSQTKQTLLSRYNFIDSNSQPFTSVMSHIETISRQSPANIAIEQDGLQLSYHELMSKVNLVAVQLQRQGVIPGDIVTVAMTPCWELVVIMLAILKCGAAYCPVDVATPSARVSYILQQTNSRLLICDADIHQGLFAAQITVANLFVSSQSCGDSVDWPDISANDSAYIIFTSGSTGQPKGVNVTHGGFANYVTWAADTYLQSGGRSAMALYSSPAFDLTVTSIYCPLIAGSKMVVYPPKHDQANILHKIVTDNVCDVIKLTPAHLNLLNEVITDTSRLTTFILGGESLSVDAAKKLQQKTGRQVSIFNEYGPTETVVGSMTYLFDSNATHDNEVAIGKPIANTAIYILDENLEPVLDGQKGELYIGGAGVTKGYINAPDLTASVFIANPFDQGRLYKTGDIASSDGELIHFYGRRDHQIKLNGYRIESGEIEQCLRECSQVKNAKVVIKSRGDAKFLCAYLALTEHRNVNWQALVAAKLPAYMVPAFFIELDELPLTVNGKVDTNELPEPEQSVTHSGSSDASRAILPVLTASACNILGKEQLSEHDNFTLSGGDSIKAISLSSLLRERGIVLEVKDILNSNNFATMAGYCVALNKIAVLSAHERQGEVLVTPAMAWFSSLNLENPNGYCHIALLSLNSTLPKQVIAQLLNNLVSEYDELSMAWPAASKVPFYTENNEVVLHDTTDSAILVNDIDIAKGKLFSAGWQAGKLALCIHHLVVDGISWRILINRLNMMLETQISTQSYSPKQPRYNLKKATEQLSHSAISANAHTYWMNIDSHFNGISALLEMEASQLVQAKASTLSQIRETLTSDLSQQLLTVANHRFSTEPVLLMLSALSLSLSELGADEFVTIELEGHGRHHNEMQLSDVIGWFTAIFPWQLPLNQGSMTDTIKQVKESYAAIPDYGESYGLLKYLKTAQPSVQAQTLRFNFLGDMSNNGAASQMVLEDLALHQDPNNHLSALIEINVAALNGEITVELNYSHSLLAHSQMQCLISNYRQQLANIADCCMSSDEVEFTPSDFSTVDLDMSDLEELFQ
ncbi:Tyrocidine synthase 2 [Pseudoalteromonas holothuriae]|uniref:Tyrocidine synthase 2 n=1 Tax=Pseudoalteromonas holothuriae TaxID=2963714 RepID=A0ABM9GHW9_9GAMM|nr:amino acid adenylation domain-containing protein [Pseudoalteromonas sp. CIP111951]CAH9057876.1 Tyrocidine synthase 2 [Pseudoalteromonas sp. CIP111951]